MLAAAEIDLQSKVAKSSTAAGGLLADLADWLAGWRTWRTGGLCLADLADWRTWRTRAWRTWRTGGLGLGGLWRTLGRLWRTLADSGGPGGLWRTWRTQNGSWLAWLTRK